MAKELIFHEDLCNHLDTLSSIPVDSIDECCLISLEVLNNDKHLSAKLLNRASAKLNIDPGQLEKCLRALAVLFLETTKQLKSYQRVLTSIEMLRIPHSARLADFWVKEVQPIISEYISIY